MLKSGLKQRDDAHKAKVAEVRAKYKGVAKGLLDQIARLNERMERDPDTVVLRNMFVTKEREFQKEIRELKEKVGGLVVLLLLLFLWILLNNNS
jgi:hypothetical protein